MPKIVPNPEVRLTDDEQEYLFALIHNGQHSARLITCARILSKLDFHAINPDAGQPI